MTTSPSSARTDRPSSQPGPLAPILNVKDSLVTIDIRNVTVMKNEVAFIRLDNQRLKAEVLRIQGGTADLQVFEDTGGVRAGDLVELSGEMLSATLAPGLLGQVLDGLGNPLEVLARAHGFFLPRGAIVPSVDLHRKWEFTPSVSIGAELVAGQTLGTVPEAHFQHRIMIPFEEPAPVEVTWIRGGSFTVSEPIARIRRKNGVEQQLTMTRKWPVRRPLPEGLIARRLANRLFPTKPLTTTQRIIDTFFPIARGGTACIPGPFGAGKTVLQSLIAQHAAVDIVIIIACGERAGEVVETIREYPGTKDPRTNGSLMERTIIVCNTSSMPVAARESSIYTGITLGEYYRQMGYHVLCIADSTSRWAQAMRETSGRMEEIPGEEAFPAYLNSAVKTVYERAGVLETPDGSLGSLTLVGTVSPAGGNFEEPVTQATLATVKTFLGLSYDRAYKRFYPAIDPLISWSRYLDQLKPWFDRHLGGQWVDTVKLMTELLHAGNNIHQMMQVIGEEGITLGDYVQWQKSQLIDLVYLQQDAFDPVDASMSRDRQHNAFRLLESLIRSEYAFEDKDQARDFFTRLANLFKNWNYSPEGSPDFERYPLEIRSFVGQYRVVPNERTE